MINIFLDDDREVHWIYDYSQGEYTNSYIQNAKDNWVVVRSRKELLRMFPLNDKFIISFDHDLGDSEGSNTPDGMDCLKEMLLNGWIPEECFFHSANHVAVKEMKSYWESYKKSLELK